MDNFKFVTYTKQLPFKGNMQGNVYSITCIDKLHKYGSNIMQKKLIKVYKILATFDMYYHSACYIYVQIKEDTNMSSTKWDRSLIIIVIKCMYKK